MAKHRFALLLAVLAAGLSGCIGNFQLVKMGLTSNEPTGWLVYSPPRVAQNPLENVVTESAQAKHNLAWQNSTIFFVATDSDATYVDVVANFPDDRLAEREVVRYRVVDGKIAAHTEITREIFPDLAFERAVLQIATRAGDPNTLMEYDGLERPVTLTARPVSGCAAVVRVFEGGKGGKGDLMAEKMVNGCFAANQSIDR